MPRMYLDYEGDRTGAELRPTKRESPYCTIEAPRAPRSLGIVGVSLTGPVNAQAAQWGCTVSED